MKYYFNNWWVDDSSRRWKKITLHKKWSFPWRISSVNVNKSACNYISQLRPLLQKSHDTFILHVCTNNCVSESYSVSAIQNPQPQNLHPEPQCKIITSNDDGKSSLTVENLNSQLNFLKVDIIGNSNTGKECMVKKVCTLSKGGLVS